jgi:hypothetical protein
MQPECVCLCVSECLMRWCEIQSCQEDVRVGACKVYIGRVHVVLHTNSVWRSAGYLQHQWAA